MDNYQMLPIDESYNSEMISILQSSPINAGGLSLCFDKSPDIFEISRLHYSDCKHVGFFLNNKLKGFASLGYHDALLDGVKEKIFTLYHFYLKPEARGRHLPEKAAKIFIEDASLKADFGYAVTMKGNRQVESYIGRQGHSWSPPSRIIDELVVKSLLFSFPRKNKTSYSVRNANLDDIPEMVKLLNAENQKRDFGQVFEEFSFQNSLINRGLQIEQYYVALNNKGEIKGVCLAWDCSSFRRTIVHKYSSGFFPVLYAYKILEKFLPMAPFPGTGDCFHELTITDYAAANRDTEIMHALLAEIYHRNLNRKYHFMNFASCRSDHLLKSVKGFWHQEIVSNIVLISLHPDRRTLQPKLPYIDIAFL
jgi:hypothetical protein